MISATTAKAIWQNAKLSGGPSPYDPDTNEAEIWQSGLDARKSEAERGTKRRTKSKRETQCYRVATTDFETDPAEPGRYMEPFAWGFYDGTTYQHYWGSNAADKLIDHIRALDTPHIIYAHNGGKFDFQFIVHALEPDILFIGSRITEARIKSNHVDAKGKPIIHKLRDSYSIIPVPLKSAADKIDFDIQKMRAERRDRYRSEILSYMKQDCVGLYDVVAKYREVFGNALTMASAAMKKLNLAMAPADHTEPERFKAFERLMPWQDAELRPFYFGGRVQCFRKGIIHGNLKIYDVTSSYPDAMKRCQHPVGNSWEITRDLTEHTDFALIDATSKGCLPRRAEDGSLEFPHARSQYFATMHEIRAALDLGLLTIHRVLHARQCRMKTSFANFIDTYFNLRQQARAEGDDTFVLFWKLVMNGAYGKFAQNPMKFKDHMLLPNDGRDRDMQEGWTPEYLTRSYTIYARKTNELYPGQAAGSFLNVATGASITGAARATLMRGLAQATAPIYCDTDSIICEALPPDMLGDNLGQWKLEAEGNKVAICEKKLYAFFGQPATDKKDRAKRIDKYGDASCIKIASKGVRLKAADILAVAAGEAIEYMPTFPNLKPNGLQVYQPRLIKMKETAAPKTRRLQSLTARVG